MTTQSSTRFVRIAMLSLIMLCPSIYGFGQTKGLLLNGIQDSIYNAFMLSFSHGNPNRIESLMAELNTLPKQNTLATYWKAYAGYYLSIHHLKFGNKKEARKAIQQAINTIEQARNKDSELYALLAMMQSFSIQFASGMSSASISKLVKDNAMKSIAADSANLRAWYVLGQNDYYTPQMYGGGKKVETYLKKAISMPDQSMQHPHMPTWGRSNAYALLVGIYIERNMCQQAKETVDKGLQLFPDDYTLNQHAATIEEQCQ